MTNQMNSRPTQPDTNDININGIAMETLKETVHAIEQEPDLGECRFRARNMWLGGTQNRTVVTGFYGAR